MQNVCKMFARPRVYIQTKTPLGLWRLQIVYMTFKLFVLSSGELELFTLMLLLGVSFETIFVLRRNIPATFKISAMTKL